MELKQKLPGNCVEAIWKHDRDYMKTAWKLCGKIIETEWKIYGNNMEI